MMASSSALCFLTVPTTSSPSSSPSIPTVRSQSLSSPPVRPFPRTNLKARSSSSSSSSSRRLPYDAVLVGSRYGHGVDEDGEDDDDDDDEEDEEEDRSLDLLVRFMHNVFRNVSRKVRKAVRSVLPPSIPPKLVRFSVNGALILTFLWILKALLEVVCTLGSMVFLSILLVRGVWSGITYIRENRYYYINPIDPDDQDKWSRVQPVT